MYEYIEVYTNDGIRKAKLESSSSTTEVLPEEQLHDIDTHDLEHDDLDQEMTSPPPGTPEITSRNHSPVINSMSVSPYESDDLDFRAKDNNIRHTHRTFIIPRRRLKKSRIGGNQESELSNKTPMDTAKMTKSELSRSALKLKFERKSEIRNINIDSTPKDNKDPDKENVMDYQINEKGDLETLCGNLHLELSKKSQEIQNLDQMNTKMKIEIDSYKKNNEKHSTQFVVANDNLTDLQRQTKLIYTEFNERKANMINELNSLNSQVIQVRGELTSLQEERQSALKRYSQYETLIHEQEKINADKEVLKRLICVFKQRIRNGLKLNEIFSMRIGDLCGFIKMIPGLEPYTSVVLETCNNLKGSFKDVEAIENVIFDDIAQNKTEVNIVFEKITGIQKISENWLTYVNALPHLDKNESLKANSEFNNFVLHIQSYLKEEQYIQNNEIKYNQKIEKLHNEINNRVDIMNEAVDGLKKEAKCKEILYNDEIVELKRRLNSATYIADDAMNLKDQVSELKNIILQKEADISNMSVMLSSMNDLTKMKPNFNTIAVSKLESRVEKLNELEKNFKEKVKEMSEQKIALDSREKKLNENEIKLAEKIQLQNDACRSDKCIEDKSSSNLLLEKNDQLKTKIIELTIKLKKNNTRQDILEKNESLYLNQLDLQNRKIASLQVSKRKFKKYFKNQQQINLVKNDVIEQGDQIIQINTGLSRVLQNGSTLEKQSKMESNIITDYGEDVIQGIKKLNFN